ncbi:hypothetical protein CMQ_3342 [Grosmannia clavigera kw1407]|uniref:G-protein coupled receptor protein n=1 Tax=Grosmannia clavigera (strain kw1407 / UAMH 11150) TaxID=655863 RepID=F0X9N6_GROCL|nr:uncharacterized protein CMQ_3342 [Grosmannia clavigera kw1407]EFX05273.1 hypothetical protein CMQ_3342 [Grosmannia clavigera kw1407]
MATKVSAVSYATPAGNMPEGPSGSFLVFPSHVGILVARGFSLFFAIIILGLSVYLMHGLVLSAYAFSLVCSIFTLAIVLYAVLTEKVSGCRAGYNCWAILALDLLMIIFWLSSMAANAALRATFIYAVDTECYDDGSTFNSGHCVVEKRDRSSSVVRRDGAVAGPVGRASMSVIAGLSALEMLLFIATFAYLAHTVRLYRRSNASRLHGGVEGGPVEMKVQSQPMLYQQDSQPTQAYNSYSNTTAQQQQQAYGSYPSHTFSTTGQTLAPQEYDTSQNSAPPIYAPSQTPILQGYPTASHTPVQAGTVQGQPDPLYYSGAVPVQQQQQQQYYQQ